MSTVIHQRQKILSLKEGKSKKFILIYYTVVFIMENEIQDKCRIVIVMTQEEKDKLKELADRDYRSMSSFMRCLLINEVNKDFFEQ